MIGGYSIFRWQEDEYVRSARNDCLVVRCGPIFSHVRGRGVTITLRMSGAARLSEGTSARSSLSPKCYLLSDACVSSGPRLGSWRRAMTCAKAYCLAEMFRRSNVSAGPEVIAISRAESPADGGFPTGLRATSAFGSCRLRDGGRIAKRHHSI
jgi:hypothetical protein